MREELVKAIKDDPDFYNIIKEGCYNSYGDKIPEGWELPQSYVIDKLKYDKLIRDKQPIPKHLSNLGDIYYQPGYVLVGGQKTTITSTFKSRQGEVTVKVYTAIGEITDVRHLIFDEKDMTVSQG